MSLPGHQEAPEVACRVEFVKSGAEAGRNVAGALAAMRQMHRGPMLLVVQVRRRSNPSGCLAL